MLNAKFISLFILRVGAAALSLVLTIAITRVLGQHESGTYFLVITIAGFVVTLSVPGWVKVIIREVSHSKSIERSEIQVISKMLLVSLFISSILIYLIYILETNIHLYSGYKDFIKYFKFMSVGIIASIVGVIAAGYFVGKELQIKSLVVGNVAFPVVMLTSIGVVWLIYGYSGDLVAELYMGSQLIVALLAIVMMCVLYLCSKRVTEKKNINIKGWDSYYLSDLMIVLSSTGLMLMASYKVGGDEYSVISVILRVISVIIMISDVIGLILMPKISRMYKNGQYQEVKNYIKKNVLNMACLSFVFIVVFWFASDLIMEVFGHQYIFYQKYLFIAGSLMSIFLVFSPFQYSFNMIGGERSILKVSMITFVFCLLFVFLIDELMIIDVLLLYICSKLIIASYSMMHVIFRWHHVEVQ